MNSNIFTLKIDNVFKSLIVPLRRKEYITLEENIISNGCLHPIIVWNNTIIDGHNRYEICQRNKIPFKIKKEDFEHREEAIIWICRNQLGRRNISEETRKYLIGKQYESEKKINKHKNPEAINQHTELNYSPYSHTKIITNNRTAQKIASENNITHATVEKYSIYSKSIDNIYKKEPEMVANILSGHYKISHNNVVALSKLEKSDIDVINQNISQRTKDFVQYSDTRNIISSKENCFPQPSNLVKTMPKYDPDSSVVEICLTIPSWISSINRIKTKTDFSIVSDQAKDKLSNSLDSLSQSIQDLIKTLKD